MSHKSHPCCDATTPVPRWEGSPAGKIVDLDGIETYISLPKTTPNESKPIKNILLFLTEVHGIHLPNSQLLADGFASQLDIPVVMPDQFFGRNQLPENMNPDFPDDSITIPWIEDESDANFENRGLQLPTTVNLKTSDAWPFAKPPRWNERGDKEFEKWMKRHGPESTEQILNRVIKECRKLYGESVKIGAIGYCFGGRYVMRLMAQKLVNVGVVAHPSFYTMEEIMALSKDQRLAILAAEKDDILPKEKRRETEDLLSLREVTWTSVVYGGTEHGFSVRGDLGTKQVRLAKEMAFNTAVEWFRAWL